jgi:hypothetical protein
MRPDISPKTHIAKPEKEEKPRRRAGFFVNAFGFLIRHLFGLIVLADLIFAAIFLVWWNDVRAYSMDNLQLERISDYQTYIAKADRNTEKIVIKTKNKDFFLHDYLLPNGMNLENVNEQLGQTTSASLWVEKGTVFIKGIETQYVNIPPSHGIEWVRQDAKKGLWVAIFLIALGIYAYYTFKRHFDLDWKLGFKDYKKGSRSGSEPAP